VWSKSAKFLIVRVKVQKSRGFTFPVPLFVVDELFEALADLVRAGEYVIKCVPLPKESNARKHLSWVKTISPSGFISITHNVLRDLRKHKGLDLVDVETDEAQVKIHLW
jgi:hypothetical protein